MNELKILDISWDGGELQGEYGNIVDEDTFDSGRNLWKSLSSGRTSVALRILLVISA